MHCMQASISDARCAWQQLFWMPRHMAHTDSQACPARHVHTMDTLPDDRIRSPHGLTILSQGWLTTCLMMHCYCNRSSDS